jgi:pimeloyl-ACP methyl ester carboxylesterase
MRLAPEVSMSSAGDIRFIQANGLEFAYLEAGQGPLVLLLHGFPDTAYSWGDTLQALAAAGYRAVAPFTRGYFPSAIPADGDYSVQTLAQDALALVAALGESSAIIVGHDWGAATGYVAANLAPAQVRKLVTIAIPPPRLLKPSYSAMRKAPHFLLFQFGRLSEWFVARNDMAYVDYLYRYWSPDWQAPAAEIEVVKQGYRQPGRLRAALGYYHALFADLLDLKKQALYRRRLTVPTLAFAGRNDGALQVELYAQMQDAVSAPCEVEIVEGAGHFLHREKPPLFLRRLLAFIGRP